MHLNRVIDKRRIFARITFWGSPTVIVGQDESGCGGGCKSTPGGGDIEIRVEVGNASVELTLLPLRLEAAPSIYGESRRGPPLSHHKKMGRGRAQSDVRDGGSAQFQEDIGERCAITTSADRACRQTKQKIGKGEEGERSVRTIGAFVELIPEYFRSKTKIVSTSRQRH